MFGGGGRRMRFQDIKISGCDLLPPGRGDRAPSPAGGLSRSGGRGKGSCPLHFINLAKSSLLGRTGARIADRGWVQGVYLKQCFPFHEVTERQIQDSHSAHSVPLNFCPVPSPHSSLPSEHLHFLLFPPVLLLTILFVNRPHP